MKRLSSILMIAFAAATFYSCKGGSDSSTSDDTTTITQDSANVPLPMTAPVAKEDSVFAVNATNDGLAEVALGKMAQEKAINKHVKAFADMMVADHTKAGDELSALAKTKNINLPAAPDADNQKKADLLDKETGKAFDKDYIDYMVDGHQRAVKLFTDASQNCKDSELKAFAAKTLPTLKMHLDSIKAIKAGMQ